jgi:hypothetical protein
VALNEALAGYSAPEPDPAPGSGLPSSPRTISRTAIRAVPLIDAALRIAQWCAAGRQVTGKNVLRPALAREVVEGLRLWTRDPELADPQIRAGILGTIAVPDFRARLTPLGRHALRAFLTSEGHIARTTADLPGMDARRVPGRPHVLPAEVPPGATSRPGWPGRDEARAITGILDAAAGDDPDHALLRGNAIVALTLIAPAAHRDLLRSAAADGADGSRQVAAAALVNLGEEPAGFPGAVQQWVTIDTLAGMCSLDALADLAPPLLDAMRSAADDLSSATTIRPSPSACASPLSRHVPGRNRDRRRRSGSGRGRQRPEHMGSSARSSRVAAAAACSSYPV